MKRKRYEDLFEDDDEENVFSQSESEDVEEKEELEDNIDLEKGLCLYCGSNGSKVELLPVSKAAAKYHIDDLVEWVKSPSIQLIRSIVRNKRRFPKLDLICSQCCIDAFERKMNIRNLEETMKSKHICVSVSPNVFRSIVEEKNEAKSAKNSKFRVRIKLQK